MITQKQIDDAVKYANMVPFSERPMEVQDYLCRIVARYKLQRIFFDDLSYDQVEEEKFVPAVLREFGEKYLSFIKLMVTSITINHGRESAEEFIHLIVKPAALLASLGWLDDNDFKPVLKDCHEIAFSGGDYTPEDAAETIENYLKER